LFGVQDLLRRCLLPAPLIHRHRAPGIHHVGRRHHGLDKRGPGARAAAVCGTAAGFEAEQQSESAALDRRGSFVAWLVRWFSNQKHRANL